MSTKRVTPRRTTKVVGTLRDTQMLSLLAWVGYLDTHQIERAAFPSRRTAQRRLRACLDHGLVKAQLNGETLHKPNIWSLTEKGCDWLLEREAVSMRPRKWRVPRASKVEHALAMRDAFLAYWLAERAGLGRLVRFVFDDELSQSEDFQSAGIIPDGLAEFAADSRLLDYLEYDAGNERHSVLHGKFERWATFYAAQPARRHNKLIVMVNDSRRARALDRVVIEAGLKTVGTVVVLSQLPSWLTARCSHTGYAPPIRAARTTNAPEPAVFAPLSRRANRGFRPLGQGE